MRKMIFATGVAAALLVSSGPVLADVKVGVDAWTRGEWATAVREWTGPAEAGDADAQFNLAQAYRLGRGVKADSKQAEALYAKAAAKGHVQAADNYGLLLFQEGRREEALPLVQAAARRGDPRAQYLLGIAHFNGDLVAKDWIRAYALASLAKVAGLPQAAAAVAQMDQHIPLADREAAKAVAASLRQEAAAARSREMAAVDIALSKPVVAQPAPVAVLPAPIESRPVAPVRNSPGQPVVIASLPSAPPPAGVPVVAGVHAKAPSITPAQAPAAISAKGLWKVQLGAFGVPGNADRLWEQLAVRPELAGRTKLKEPEGRLTKLLAGGFATQAEAQSACTALKGRGQNCIVTR